MKSRPRIFSEIFFRSFVLGNDVSRETWVAIMSRFIRSWIKRAGAVLVMVATIGFSLLIYVESRISIANDKLAVIEKSMNVFY